MDEQAAHAPALQNLPVPQTESCVHWLQAGPCQPATHLVHCMLLPVPLTHVRLHIDWLTDAGKSLSRRRRDIDVPGGLLACRG